MSEGSAALAFLAIASWLASFLLVRKAIVKPRIGALTAWAASAVVLSAFGSISLLILINRDAGYAFFDIETGRRLFASVAFAVLLIPPVWLALYGLDRLGGGHE